MTTHYVLYFALVVVSAAVSACVAALAWRNRDVEGGAPLAVLMAALTVWAVGKAFELSAASLAATLFWVNVQYVGIVAVPVAWLAFALRYTGRGTWLDRRGLALLSAEPIAILLLSATDGSHGLFRSSIDLVSVGPFSVLASTAGPAFWVHTAYSYLLLAAGTWLIVRMVVVSEHLYRGQSVGLLAFVAIPWAVNGVYLAGLLPRYVDLTIVAFAASGFVILWTISRHRLLSLIPAARELARAELIERMSDAVIVVDDRDRVVDCNPAARRVLGCSTDAAIGRPLAAVAPALQEAVGEAGTGDAGETSSVREGGGVADAAALDVDQGAHRTFSTWDGTAHRYYDVRVSPLRRGRGLLAGRLISVRDVSEHRQREQRLDVLNRLLRHDVRNELNIVLGTAELIRDDGGAEDGHRRAEAIEAAAGRMVERAEKVTRAANRSDMASSGPMDVVVEVDAILDAMRREYPDAAVTADRPEEAWTSAGPAVATAIDEIVTNAIEHGGDDVSVHVSVSTSTDTGAPPGDRVGTVQVEVADDGPGIPRDEVAPVLRGEETPMAHSTGVGLWIVTWLVREAGGDVAFEADEHGTTVTVQLPGASRPERESAAGPGPGGDESGADPTE